jgi:hypothetical protein
LIAKILGISGEGKRRHPYKLSEHSNSNKNFEIHIFANTNIPGKSGMLQNFPLFPLKMISSSRLKLH